MIIEYFNSLSKHELNLLEKFIRSPWFNTSDPLKRFFYYLKKKYPDVSKEDLNRLSISDHVYYGKIDSEENIRKLISDLCMLIERG